MSNFVKQSRFFYGWWIVVAVAVGLFMGYVPIIGFTFGVFFTSLVEEFKWSRAEVSLAFSLSLLALSVALPLTGRLVDRFGARRVILSSVLLFGLALASLYFLTASLWHYYVIFVVIGVVGGGISPVPYYNVITHWFDRRRGLALGLAMIGVGLSEFIMPSFAHALIARVGWRLAYVIIGAMVMAVTFPVVALFLKEAPREMGLWPDGVPVDAFDDRVSAETREQRPSDASGLTGREAWRNVTFWLMSCAL